MIYHRMANQLKEARQKAEICWDIVRRVFKQSAEDNVPFLAGGLAFNVLLALVPFVLLLVAGLSFMLGNQPAEAANSVVGLVRRLLPSGSQAADDLLRSVIVDILETRGSVTLYSAIGFAWFSTRLFGSLRSVLVLIFDHSDRGIVAGKLFDLLTTAVATIAVVMYVVFNAYLSLATTRGLELLKEIGLRESAMGGLTYFVGRLLGVVLVLALFAALYRGLPRRRPATSAAMIGGATAALLFELARHVFAIVIRRADLGSLYTGSIAVIVAVVFWAYYASFLFLLGGEVTQAVALRAFERDRLTGGAGK